MAPSVARNLFKRQDNQSSVKEFTTVLSVVQAIRRPVDADKEVYQGAIPNASVLDPHSNFFDARHSRYCVKTSAAGITALE